MNLNGLNMEYLAHHILKQSGILESRVGCQPTMFLLFYLIATPRPLMPPRDDDSLKPDCLIPNTWYLIPHSPFTIPHSQFTSHLNAKMSVGRLDIVPPEGNTQPSPIHYSPFTLKQNMSVGRLELPTNGLKGHCSTIELHAHNQVIIVAREGGCVNKNPAVSSRISPSRRWETGIMEAVHQ